MKFIDSAGIVAFLTAYFYCVSTAFTYGYFYTLGLDSDLLDRNFHQVIYHGMITSLENAIYLSAFILLFGFIYSNWCFFIFFYIKKSFSHGRRLVRLKKKINLPTKKLSKRELSIKAIFSKSIGVFLVVIGFLSVLIVYEKSGMEQANELRIRISEGESIIMKSSQYKGELTFLYCGSRNCAGYNPETEEVIYIPQQDISIDNNKIKI